jgi:hypothetical protein
VSFSSIAFEELVPFLPTAFGRACFVRAYYTHVVGLVLFDGELTQEVDRRVNSCLQRVADRALLSFLSSVGKANHYRVVCTEL